jgi:hypothetical protein
MIWDTTAGRTVEDYAGYTGIASVLALAGPVEAGHASETELIMRHKIKYPAPNQSLHPTPLRCASRVSAAGC